MPMTTAMIQDAPQALVAQLHTLIHAYGVSQMEAPLLPEEWQAAVRDALVEMRHICDAEGLDYAAADKTSYRLYCEELGAIEREGQR